MFLFSGTFFPIARLPAPLEVLAYLTPLWHGVDLCRMLVLGDVGTWLALAHVVYLLAFVGVGLALALFSYRRRLVV
jgi:lipooligosaccharide transport system permease protein